MTDDPTIAKILAAQAAGNQHVSGVGDRITNTNGPADRSIKPIRDFVPERPPAGPRLLTVVATGKDEQGRPTSIRVPGGQIVDRVPLAGPGGIVVGHVQPDGSASWENHNSPAAKARYHQYAAAVSAASRMRGAAMTPHVTATGVVTVITLTADAKAVAAKVDRKWRQQT